MVKNVKGGSRHKKMARKHLAQDNVKVKTRLANPKESCETYATVTKMYGQGNCQVLCCDGKERLCVIRKIFKGRNKSKNFITADTKVLVGLRDWESARHGKQDKCDLLEVYDRSQHNDLKNDPFCKWDVIASSVEKDMINNGTADMFEFTTNIENEETDNTNNQDTNNDESDTINTNENDDINIDDI
jgi:initiation factor 1A